MNQNKGGNGYSPKGISSGKKKYFKTCLGRFFPIRQIIEEKNIYTNTQIKQNKASTQLYIKFIFVQIHTREGGALQNFAVAGLTAPLGSKEKNNTKIGVNYFFGSAWVDPPPTPLPPPSLCLDHRQENATTFCIVKQLVIKKRLHM